jgi:primosomal protein N' (replication factor Y)
MLILRLAIPAPLRRCFDYLPPEGMTKADIQALQPGCRVKVKFGNRDTLGVLIEVADHSDWAIEQLKPAVAVLDSQSPLPQATIDLCHWAANYYQHPIGDVFSHALPVLLRKGEALLSQQRWRLSTNGKGLPAGALSRAPKQAACLALLQQQDIDVEQLKAAGLARSHLNQLLDKGLAESYQAELTAPVSEQHVETPLPLNSEQQAAVDRVLGRTGFHSYLLDGITGSGKTEVYLQLIQHYLDQGQQVLVLVPEIGLTPQTEARFRRRFNCHISLLHSGLTDRERLQAWQLAGNGSTGIVIGTRSAIFTPLPKLGLIVVDEEHDASLKQQDGFRYSARDIAVKRGFDQQCPVILGSATPALESLFNAQQGRYQHLQLTQRATGAPSPHFHLLDIRKAPLQEGFSPDLLRHIGQHIQQGNQVLVFINRRGFAPTVLCHDCGWVAKCSNCDARLTTHLQQKRLRCHHCEYQQGIPSHCPDCRGSQLHFQGVGTERSERFLQRQFPGTAIYRIDRDSTARKDSLSNILNKVHSGQPCILVGTQMLAKGHHFPDVTLVAMLDIDGGLFSADFRGPEKMGQLLTQVAGRAGRANKPGTVLIQSHQPDHPLLQLLLNSGYGAFAQQLLAERQPGAMPPFGFLAMLRADAKQLQQAEQFLHELRRQAPASGAQLLGPLPSPMTKRAGRYRAQLLIHSAQRKQLHQTVSQLLSLAEQHPLGKRLQWSIDIDPLEML